MVSLGPDQSIFLKRLVNLGKKTIITRVTKKWLESRRLFLKRIKEQVRLLSGEPDVELSLYEKSLSDFYSLTWERSTEEIFRRNIESAQFVLCGDFHSSPGAQKFHAKWISEYLANHKEEQVVVALECFMEHQQDYFNAWVSGSITDELFLDKVDWEYQWGFNFESYKALIQKLSQQNVRFICVNSDAPSLKERDDEIFENIKKSTKVDEKVFVLIGQYHLAPGHLPQGFNKNVVSVHLNSEELYFALSDRGLENDVEVLKRESHFCFLNSPPWIQWQDHLFYLEEQYEEDQFLSGDDFNQVVFDYIGLIKKDLLIDNKHKMFGVSFVDELMDDDFEIKWGDFVLPMVESESSFYWPEKEEGVLVVPSFNHAASVAGRFVHADLMGLKELPKTDNLIAWTWLEAVGYFMSKLINPKRSPRSIKNMTAFLNSRMSQEEAQDFVQKLIKSRVGELSGGKSLKGFETWTENINAARLKGSLLGESLFNHYVLGQISVDTLKNYFSMPLYPTNKFDSFYNFLVARLESGD